MPTMMFDSEAGYRLKQIQKTLRSQNGRKGWRYKVWQFTESAYSSRGAFMYAGISKLVVLISVLVSFMNASSINAGGNIAETIFEVFFGLELTLRFICCPHSCHFMLGFFNIVDFLSVLPLAHRLTPSSVGLLSEDGRIIVCSLVPFIRLLKLMKWFEKLQLLLHAFELALEALPSLLYSMALIALFFAEVLYVVEPRESIESLPYAVWFTIVTMSTVGYGDYTPATDLGYIVASVLIITSALYMAMPLGIVGNAFSEVWNDRDRLLVIKRFRGAFLQGGFTVQAFQDIFAMFDTDGNGTLDIDEFRTMLQTIQLHMSEDRLIMLFQALDQDGAGYITLDKLLTAIMPKSLASSRFAISASKLLRSWSLANGNPIDWVTSSQDMKAVGNVRSVEETQSEFTVSVAQ
jgi:hypothetical protein